MLSNYEQTFVFAVYWNREQNGGIALISKPINSRRLMSAVYFVLQSRFAKNNDFKTFFDDLKANIMGQFCRHISESRQNGQDANNEANNDESRVKHFQIYFLPF